MIPPVILDTIAKNNPVQRSSIAFWNIQQTPLVSDDAFGPALEQATTDCLLKRLERPIPPEGSAKWRDILPFLQVSPIFSMFCHHFILVPNVVPISNLHITGLKLW
jgi:hypothetical protein